MQRWIRALDRLFEWLEGRIGVLGASLMAGIGVYLLAMGYVSGEEFRPGPHGKLYMALSETPFDFATQYDVGYRRLGPILGYLLGLRGDNFLWLTIAAGIGIPVSIFAHLRNGRKMAPAAALGVATLIGLSSVLVLHFIARGYVDPIYYLLILWAFLLADRSDWAMLFMALAPLVHECTLVLWPAWLLLRLRSAQQNDQPPYLSILKSILVILPWIAWRIAAKQVLGIEASFDFGFYFTEDNFRYNFLPQIPYIPLGAFFALKLAWLLPLQHLHLAHQQQDRWLVAAIAVGLLGVAAQTLIAVDLGRLFSLAFPLVVLAAIHLYEAEEKEKFSAKVWWLVLLGLPLMTYYVVSYSITPLTPWVVEVLLGK